jgi:hypothetical protein
LTVIESRHKRIAGEQRRRAVIAEDRPQDIIDRVTTGT